MLVSHPTGNQNVRNALVAFEDANMLASFVTTLAAFHGNMWERLGRTHFGSDFMRRSYDSRFRSKTLQNPWWELGRLAATKAGLTVLTKHETGLFCTDRVYRRQDRLVASLLTNLVASRDVSAVYCYEDGALKTFMMAKKLGLRCIYDLPTGYWRAKHQLLLEESELQPDWASLLPGLRDSEEKCRRKEREIELADEIVVASRFTASTIDSCPLPVAKPSIIPYGAPTVANSDSASKLTSSGDKALRVLYVGSISQQKGMSYISKAIDLAGNAVQMTIVGRKSTRNCKALNAFLERCSYIPSLPHDQVLSLMKDHDVFLFPSLFDGFGLVILEAMSQGLVVIATPNCAAPDVITDGVDGYIVKLRDADAIAERMLRLHDDRELLGEMQSRAIRRAEEFSWERYRTQLVDVIGVNR